MATEADYMFLPLAEAAVPVRGTYFERVVNGWWVVHPDRGLAFYNPVSPVTRKRRMPWFGHPQYNEIEAVVRGMGAEDAPPFEFEVRQVPVVFIPISSPAQFLGMP